MLAGQVVFGVQQVALSAFEHCSPLAQFAEQLTAAPVHGSVNEPQVLAGQVLGVQQVFWSAPPPVPHCSPAAQVALQVKVVPLHGSFQVPAHWFGGHPVAGAQQVALSAFEHCSPLAQLALQSTAVPVHGSVNLPQ